MKPLTATLQKPDWLPDGGSAPKAHRPNQFLALNAKFLITLRDVFLVLVGICYFVQFIIEPSLLNVSVATITVICGSLLFVNHFQPVKLQGFPVSGLMVTMPIMTSLLFPLIFTTLEWKPLIFNLKEPISTFSVAAICSATLVIAHTVYRKAETWRKAQIAFRNSVLKPIGCFNNPSAIQFWALGFIGMTALIYIYVVRGDNNEERTGTLVKIIEGVMPFAYAPFVLLMPGLYGASAKASTKTKFFIVCYFCFLLVFAMASNYRYAFAIALMMPILSLMIGLLTGLVGVPKIRISILAVGIIVAPILYVAFSQLALAMQVARENRGQITGAKMISVTVDTLFDKEAMTNIRENIYSVETSEQGYSEYYIANPLVARFIYTKYDDNGHFYRKQLSAADAGNFRRFMFDRLLAQLPAPLLDLFSVDVDKSVIASISYGDWFVLMSTKIDHGAFRTGSYQAGAFLAFGYFYPLVIFVCALGVFFVLDLFVVTDASLLEGRRGVTIIGIAPLCLIYIHSLVFFTARESLTDWLGFLIRFFPQMIIMYLLLVYLTKPLNLIARR